MNVFMWHVHGSYMTALVRGDHTYYVPVTPDRDADGLGRARTFEWPPSVVEVTREEAADLDVDAVVLQRPHELHGLAQRWLGGRIPGRDVPALYLEHSSPQGRIADMRHAAADRPELLLVHVTHFNRLFWDVGSTPTTVIEHGVIDPGYLYTGELERAAVVINEPVRRGRVTGTDLLPAFEAALPIDLFGIGVESLGGHENVPQSELHEEIARRRAYVHPIRWTSLGLSLLEAMHLGIPVVALATTEVVEAVPPEAGVVSNRIDVLLDALRRFVRDPEDARLCGKAAREAALARFSLARFLSDWDRVFEEVCS